jgi:hypothetical protein
MPVLENSCVLFFGSEFCIQSRIGSGFRTAVKRPYLSTKKSFSKRDFFYLRRASWSLEVLLEME